MSRSGQHTAFTLIELAVVLTVIVVLLAMLLPGTSQSSYMSRLMQNANQVRYVHQGLLSYSYRVNSRLYPYHAAEPAYGLELKRTLIWGKHVAEGLTVSPFDEPDAGVMSYNTSPDELIWQPTDNPSDVVIGDRAGIGIRSNRAFSWGYNDNHVAIKSIACNELQGSDFE